MKEPLLIVFFSAAAVLLATVVWVFYYKKATEKLNRLDKNTQKTWSQTNTLLNERFALITKVTDAVRVRGLLEKDAYYGIIELKKQAQTAASPEDIIRLSNQLSGVLARMLGALNKEAVVNDKEYQGLLIELVKQEAKVIEARDIYNEAIKKYNRSIRLFPMRIVAFRYGYESKLPYSTSST